MNKENNYPQIRNKLSRYLHNYRTRRQLLKLDERALNDIGLTRADALQEAAKPFWKSSHSVVTTETDKGAFPRLSMAALCGCLCLMVLMAV